MKSGSPEEILQSPLKLPLTQLEKNCIQHHFAIEAWFRDQWRKTIPPLYASVDVRNAGFKIAPVDTNLFPAGFNNLNPTFLPLAIQAMTITLEKLAPGCKRLLLIPESHTRNLYYLENVYQLQMLLQKAGFDVRVGTLLTDIHAATAIDLPSGVSIILEPILRSGNSIILADYSPCTIILNHDLSEGIPDILKDIKQSIFPPLALGWHARKKSQHFSLYDKVCQQFAEAFGWDPWLFNAYFSRCDQLDFSTGNFPETFYQEIDAILAKTQKKYDAYRLTQTPFVAIKSDAGTYGMGVMMARSSDELRQLNRKQRTKMATGKGRQVISEVLIQEGVPTIEKFGENQASAEPVVYMIGAHVIGGFYRFHSEKSETDNLNSPGMEFHPIAFENACNNPDFLHLDCPQNRFYVYSVIARLALLAASMEYQLQPGGNTCT